MLTDSICRVLLVKLRHIGDTLILTPTLTAIRAAYPQARIDVLVRDSCEGILAGCPAVDTIYTTAAPEAKQRGHLGWLDQVRQIQQFRRNRYDWAFDMTAGDRSRLIVGLSGAKNRVTNPFLYNIPPHLSPFINQRAALDLRGMHVVEQDYQLVANYLPLPETPPPLAFSKPEIIVPEPYQSLSHFAVMHTATRWKRKEWPVERWVEVGQHLLQRFEHIIVSVGPAAAEIALGDQIVVALGERASNTRGAMDFSTLAALLYRAQFFVGVDTAVMHLAAACQVPMVALFGPTDERLWRPWGHPQAQIVFPEGKEVDAYKNGVYDPTLLNVKGITVESVKQACDAVLASFS